MRKLSWILSAPARKSRISNFVLYEIDIESVTRAARQFPQPCVSPFYLVRETKKMPETIEKEKEIKRATKDSTDYGVNFKIFSNLPIIIEES